MKTLLLLLTLSLPLNARIGETLEELENRFGKPEKMTSPIDAIKIGTYHRNGIKITVEFVNGTSSKELYSGELTLDEAEAILAKQGKGQFKRHPVKEGYSPAHTWRNENGSITGWYNSSLLIISDSRTKPFEEKLKEAYKATPPRVEGF